ncbi:MAG TPA: killer suppression protein [Chloroflexota bacterium]|jgi:proteic killer suppression protein
MAPIIRRRLVQIEAAETLADLFLLPGRCHLLTGDRAGAWALDVRHGWRLVFEPAELARPDDGETEFSPARITKVRVINIEDYHG